MGGELGSWGVGVMGYGKEEGFYAVVGVHRFQERQF